MFKKIKLFYFLIGCLSLETLAQPVEKIVKVIVAPDHADWTYTIGEKVKFNVSV